MEKEEYQCITCEKTSDNKEDFTLIFCGMTVHECINCNLKKETK